MSDVILHTDGSGLWSSRKAGVRITGIELDYIDEDFNRHGVPTYGSFRVYFDESTWNVDQDGLIYTDDRFLRELRRFFKEHGLPGRDVDYTEQGMQGTFYVSCNCEAPFLKAWGEKFGIDWNKFLKKQQRLWATKPSFWAIDSKR